MEMQGFLVNLQRLQAKVKLARIIIRFKAADEVRAFCKSRRAAQMI